jgi:DNA-nicking Smr family endonuclease
VTRRRKLTPEEDALWRKATQDVSRYQPQKHPAESLVSASQGLGAAPRKRSQGPIEPTLRSSPASQSQSADPFASGDPKLDRLAGRGRIEIDAVLDLHGHRQETARTTLHRFIAVGHARGARCLLVITGKGAGADTAGRGVLRARFRDWVNEELVRGYVSRAARAHQRHGGDGAFYVFLKR